MSSLMQIGAPVVVLKEAYRSFAGQPHACRPWPAEQPLAPAHIVSVLNTEQIAGCGCGSEWLWAHWWRSAFSLAAKRQSIPAPVRETSSYLCR